VGKGLGKHQSPPHINESKRQEGDVASSRIWSVCGDCNNGWMSEIESAAIPVMAPLLQGQSLVLTPPAQETLAIWTTLKTIIGESHDPANASIPIESIKRFYKSRDYPDNLKIWIGHYNGSTWANGARYAHYAVYLTDEPIAPPSSDELVRNNTRFYQTSTFVMGKLYIHAFSATRLIGRGPGYSFTKRAPLRQIYPLTRDSFSWPIFPSLDDGGASYIAALLDKRFTDGF
jgi:hypothetical protein